MRNTIYVALLFIVPMACIAQTTLPPVVQLEHRVSALEEAIQYTGDTGIPLFLFGAFCALWAQNTSRNPWLWFFLGVFFNVIAVLVVLYKNAEDRRDARVYPTPLTDRFGNSRNENA